MQQYEVFHLKRWVWPKLIYGSSAGGAGLPQGRRRTQLTVVELTLAKHRRESCQKYRPGKWGSYKTQVPGITVDGVRMG